MKQNFFVIYIPLLTDPEITIKKQKQLESIAKEYTGKTIGLVKIETDESTKRQKIKYFEGTFEIISTLDVDKRKMDSYYVRVKRKIEQKIEDIYVPIDVGDGLFLEWLPTNPLIFNSRYSEIIN